MFLYYLHVLFIIHWAQCNSPTSLKEWFDNRLKVNSAPVTYILHLEDEETVYPNFKSKRSIAKGIKTNDHSFVAEIVKQFDATRRKRAPENVTLGQFSRNSIGPIQGPKDIHLKANLRYHHQQRHPNGTVYGSYAQMDPSGQLKVMHYVNDDKGFREYAEGSEPSQPGPELYQPIKSPSGIVDIVTNGNVGIVPPPSPESNKQNRRGINPLDSSNLNFVPSVNTPYSIATPVDGLSPTPILHSAASSVNQFTPKSPLFDKYYRPSPEEVQKSYEYHRLRSALDPNAFRPTDMTPIPDIPRDKQPELRSVYSEYQIPYSARVQSDSPSPYIGLSSPTDTQYTAPPLAASVPLLPPQDVYPRPLTPLATQSSYPQTLEPQAPIYQQSYDGQPFIPASTYSGPYLPNTATFNQPYPTNVPIYNAPLPQNIPTYSQPAPEQVPVYSQPQLPGYGPNVYFASASGPQPAVITKP